MPQASTFTIKDGASTPADTVFTNIQPAGGNLPSVYLAKAKGPATNAQPKIAVSSTGTAKTRETRTTVRTPYWVTGVDGVTRVQDSCFTETRTVIPETVPDAVRSDHAAYVANSLDVAQVRESVRDGYAPT